MQKLSCDDEERALCQRAVLLERDGQMERAVSDGLLPWLKEEDSMGEDSLDEGADQSVQRMVGHEQEQMEWY